MTFQTSRYIYIYIIYVCVYHESFDVRYRKGEKRMFPLSLLSASHEALINLVRLFRDGRKKSGAKEVQEVEGEQRGGGSL